MKEDDRIGNAKAGAAELVKLLSDYDTLEFDELQHAADDGRAAHAALEQRARHGSTRGCRACSPTAARRSTTPSPRRKRTWPRGPATT